MIRCFLISALLMISFIWGQAEDTTLSIPAGNDSTVVPGDSLPPLRTTSTPPETLQFGKPFFEYKSNIDQLQMQIDSLKQIIKIYQKQRVMPQINEKLLDLIRMPEIQNRITLQNGSVVLGEIISESADQIIVRTSIGRLAIDRNYVVRIEKESPPAAKVELLGEPFVNAYPDREEISGAVKNVGKKRADFVRVIAQLWTNTTELVALDSVFVTGKEIKYESGVITDTAIIPEQTVKFKITVPLPEGAKVSYRTYTVHWEETK
ncbi:MAG: hypothetical protein GXO92_08205 [FCB group bacterium]|nr:hypothetical protein [FCB group bacterium]